MPFGLRKLFGKRSSTAASIRAPSSRTTNSHWNEKARTYEPSPQVPIDASTEDVSANPGLLAMAIFHSLPQSSEHQRTAEWLGENDPAREKVLIEFLRLFNWNGESIVQAFRTLCTRIQFKGESQHLDRVVDLFSRRWIECNTHHLFMSQSVVYTVAYSILLLNTDLHTKVDVTKTNMTMKQYVKYVTESLNRLFASERPQFAKVTDYSAFLESEKPTITSFVADNRNYARSEWFSCMAGILRLFYRSIAACPLVIPDDFQMRRKEPEPTQTPARRMSIGTLNSSLPGTTTEPTEFSKFGDQDNIDKLRLLGAPWAKEGPLKFQYFNDVETGVKKQHKSEWNDLFALADSGQLRLYKLRNRMANSTNAGDGNFLNQAQLVHSFVLTNALAQNADQSENPGEWSLLLSGDRLLRFRTGSTAAATEYVYTCNYWAARLSKPPLVEMVSSTEYGWSRPVELVQGRRDMPSIFQSSNDTIVIGDERITIFEWKNRQASELHSSYAESEQLAFLEEYVANIDSEFAQHSMVLGDMLRIFTPKYTISQRAHSNWEARSQFLLKETVQYTTYCKTLTQAIEDGKTKNVNLSPHETPIVDQKGFDDAVDTHPVVPPSPAAEPPAVPHNAPRSPSQITPVSAVPQGSRVPQSPTRVAIE